jgi:hypothetical protein
MINFNEFFGVSIEISDKIFSSTILNNTFYKGLDILSENPKKALVYVEN